MKIVLTGGGSGGHIFPLIAIVREFRSLYLQMRFEQSLNVFGEKIPPDQMPKEHLEIYYLGPRDDFSLILLNQEGVKTKEILAGKLRRYFSFKSLLENIFDIFIKTPIGIIQSFFRLFFLAPDLIFSKGGHGSFPVVVAGWLLGVPIFLHESDVDPGLVNWLLAKFAKKIFVSFPKTEKFPPSKMILVGNPIRTEILQGSIEEAKQNFKVVGDRPVILVLGGSQGAQRINDLILAILPNLVAEFEVFHQAGENNFLKVVAEAKVTIPDNQEIYYHPFPFFQELEYKQVLALADLVVGRAGAGTIFELAAAGKPSILIPLPEAAQGHQLKNAYAFAKTGATVVIEEANLTPNFFLEKLKFLFSLPLEREKMAKAALAFAKPGAAKAIALSLSNFFTP